MLQAIHDNLKGVFAMIILGVLAVVFIFWGVEFVSVGGLTATQGIEVNGQDVNVSEVQQNYQEQVTQYQVATGVADVREQIKQGVIDAAVASELCAKLYGLNIVKEGIEDADSNSTRFQLISKTPYEGQGEKCSTIFAVSHSAGSLQSVLNVFAEADINLTRIASTPHKGDPGNYTFFCDFEGSDKDPKIQCVLTEIEELTKEMLFLGCYPKWNT